MGWKEVHEEVQDRKPSLVGLMLWTLAILFFRQRVMVAARSTPLSTLEIIKPEAIVQLDNGVLQSNTNGKGKCA